MVVVPLLTDTEVQLWC